MHQVPLAQTLHKLLELSFFGAVRDPESDDDLFQLIALQFSLAQPNGMRPDHGAAEQRGEDEAENEGNDSDLAHRVVQVGGGHNGKAGEERGHYDEAELCKAIHQVVDPVSPGPKHREHGQVEHEHAHDEIELRRALLNDDDAQVQDHSPSHKHQAPPVHVRAVLDEEELPTHLHPRVVEVPHAAEEYGAAEEAYHAETPDKNAHNLHREEVKPLSLEANDAAIRNEGLRTVWVWTALEKPAGDSHDASEERVDQGHGHVPGPI
mmetsp:Transcript_78148/g.181334  ORF Transcript_78148/g.181334 Transcript_78148/m.181334 type:complete len:264 (+) Transcript_78148:302-1093(+)